MSNNNAVIYCRVSSLEQVDGTSLEMQERMCKEYAGREGYTVAQVFIEKGESAKTAHRTEFTKAITYSTTKKNLISAFIVYKLDRFARNQLDHTTIQGVLRKHKVRLLSVTEPIDDTPTGRLMEGVLSAFSEFDNNVRTERSSNGMKERLKQGVWVWQAPIGYKRLEKAGNLVIDENYSHYIQIAFEEFSKGTHTYRSLATLLDKKGFKTKQGKGAIPQLMEKIIKNPLYCGVVRGMGIETDGVHTPLISKELFRKCNSTGRKHLYPSKSSINPSFPLRGHVVCGYCGQKLTASFSTGRGGKKYGHYQHQKHNCPHAKSVRKQEMEEAFLKLLDEVNPTLQYENAFKAVVKNEWEKRTEHTEKHNNKVQKDISSLELQKENIYKLVENGTYSQEQFSQRMESIEQQIFEKQNCLLDVNQNVVNIDQALEHCFSLVRNTKDTWLKYENEPEKRLRFHGSIFEEKLSFLDGGFGTAKLSPIYSIYQQYLYDSSQLVSLQQVEPI